MVWDPSIVLEVTPGSSFGEGLWRPHGRCSGQLFCVALLCDPQYRTEVFADSEVPGSSTPVSLVFLTSFIRCVQT